MGAWHCTQASERTLTHTHVGECVRRECREEWRKREREGEGGTERGVARETSRDREGGKNREGGKEREGERGTRYREAAERNGGR